MRVATSATTPLLLTHHPAMKAPVGTIVAAVIVVGAAGVALLRPWGGAGGADQTSPPPVHAAEEANPASAFAPSGGASLPANHPPIEGALSRLPAGHPSVGQAVPALPTAGGSPATADEAPAITWKVPAGWTSLPNPNAMRIATYRPAADSELIVVRAGGTTDANIERWIGQFDEPAQTQRSRKTIHGLGVEILEVRGTYAGSGMPGAPTAPRPGWSLLGAVVETPGTSYFFKLVGPSDQVQSAHASFDALVASIRPL